MSVSQVPLTPEQNMIITNHINNYRSLHSSPNLTIKNTITDFSLNWSSYLLKNNLFQHSNNQTYGENLAYFKGYTEPIVDMVKRAIDMWYNEIFLYDYNNPGFAQNTGHFTILVWKSSLEYGMGVAINKDTNEIVITMNTSPPGNIIGQFKENVFPKTIPVEPLPLPEPPTVPDNGTLPETLIPDGEEEEEYNEDDDEPDEPEYKEHLSKIISGLYDIIQMIQTRKNAYSIRIYLMQMANLARNIDDNAFPDKMSLLSSIYNLISIIRRRYSRYLAVRYIANMIHMLEKYIISSDTA